MAAQVGEALDAGALGFATSRTEIHRTSAGQNIGTLTADERELLAIADAMAEAGSGVTQLISDLYQTPDDEFAERELDLLEAFVRHQRPSAELHGAAGVPLARPLAVPDGLGRPHGGRRPRREDTGGAPPDRRAARPADLGQPVRVLRVQARSASLAAARAGAALRDPERKRRILAEHAELAATLEPGICPADHRAAST